MALQISDLFIYPVKGLRGISLKEADALEKGFRYDRRWMLTDKKGVFLSQRELPGLALIYTALVGESLAISYQDSSIMVPLKDTRYSDDREKVSVWNDVLEARIVGKNFDEWFSDILRIDVKFCFMPEQAKRKVETKYGANSTVSFADAYPYMIISQASLDDLNSKLDEPVSINRFRPNMVIAGSEAFQEDTWKQFSVGEAVFRGIKLCGRCQVPAIDQETGIMGKEPLLTLAKYRKFENNIKFGLNCVVEKPGTVKVGDVISLL